MAPALIVAITLAVFGPAVRYDFIRSWDDGAMLLYNANLTEWSFGWMWHTVFFGHWAPLTWLTHTWDAHVWGLWAGGWHLENVLLHAGSAVLVYYIGRRLIGHEVGAVVAALLFAIHPMRMESVVWISERKDTLSCLFVLASILCYLRWAQAEAPRRRDYVWSLVFFTLAVMSKSIAVVVTPFVLLLDYGLGRRALVEKIPYVLMSAVGTVIAFYALRHGVANLMRWQVAGLGPRLWQFAYSEVYYAWRTVWPSRLSYMIEYTWVPSWTQPQYPMAAGICVLTVLALWWLKSRWITAAVLAYAVAVLPQAGLFQNGPQLVANRYSYIACIPLALLVGALVEWAGVRRPRLAVLTAATAIGALIVVTAVHLPTWRDDATLQTYAAAAEPTCTRCQDWAAIYAYTRGDLPAARAYFEQAIRVSATTQMPRWERYWGLGAILEQMGDRDAAAAAFRAYLDAVPPKWRAEPYEQLHMRDAELRLARLTS